MSAPIVKKHPVIAAFLMVPVIITAMIGYAIGLIIGPFISGILGGWNAARKSLDLETLEKED